MKLLHSIEETRRIVDAAKSQGKAVGIVPTMGALHDGHLSLVERAIQECEFVIATIFVNPTQFAPQEDFAKYPRTLETDLARLEEIGCNAVFVPTESIMYPEGCSAAVVPPRVALELEGHFRPTHFAGVCTVVLKLFNIVQPTDAYFGLKDYQQFAVLRQMSCDFNLPITVHGCTTIRESDGLAMSSRNRYLSAAERQTATALNRALRKCYDAYLDGIIDRVVLEEIMLNELTGAGITDIQYAVVRDSTTLLPSDQACEDSIALIAARVGTTRLIDNLLFKR